MADIVTLIADAIARQEGYLDVNSLAHRNNNPGNLRSWGKNKVVNGFVVFPNPQAGRAALERQVRLNIARGLTLVEFFGGKAGVYGGFAPSEDGNWPLVYAQNVSRWTGIPLDVPLDQVK